VAAAVIAAIDQHIAGRRFRPFADVSINFNVTELVDGE
jgi:hypothetical protein